MTKKLLPLMLCFWLVACSKSDSPDPEPVDADSCVLQENVVTSAAGKTTYKFMHDAGGKLLKREVFENEVLSRYNVYEYNNQDLIATELFFRADGTQEAYYSYLYDEDGLLTQMESRQLVNGTMQHTFTCVYDYISEDQVWQRRMQHPDGRLMSLFQYEYENGQMRSILTFNSSGQLTQTALLEYDDKKPPLSNMDALRKINWLMVGYPHQHNITRYTNTLANGQVSPDSYSSFYRFNASGLPDKATRVHEDGRQIFYDFTYKCE